MLQESKVSKGGTNPPNTSSWRPPAPGGSGGIEKIRREAHNMLDKLVAEYLLENPNSVPSEISAMQLLEWHHKKIQEVKVKVPEECGAWVKEQIAGRIDGTRGSVAWSAPFTEGKMVVVAVCPKGCIDGAGQMLVSFTKLIHVTCLNNELASLSALVGFDCWHESLGLAQGL